MSFVSRSLHAPLKTTILPGLSPRVILRRHIRWLNKTTILPGLSPRVILRRLISWLNKTTILPGLSPRVILRQHIWWLYKTTILPGLSPRVILRQHIWWLYKTTILPGLSPWVILRRQSAFLAMMIEKFRPKKLKLLLWMHPEFPSWIQRCCSEWSQVYFQAILAAGWCPEKKKKKKKKEQCQPWGRTFITYDHS